MGVVELHVAARTTGRQQIRALDTAGVDTEEPSGSFPA